MKITDVTKLEELSHKVVSYLILKEEDLSFLDNTSSLLSDEDKLLFFSYLIKNIRKKKRHYISLPEKEISKNKIKFLNLLETKVISMRNKAIDAKNQRKTLEGIMDENIDPLVITTKASLDMNYLYDLDNYLLNLKDKNTRQNTLLEKINEITKKDKANFLQKYIVINQNKMRKIPSSNIYFQHLLSIENVLFHEYFKLLETEMLKTNKEESEFFFENITFLDYKDRVHMISEYVKLKIEKKKQLEEKLIVTKEDKNEIRIISDLSREINYIEYTIEKLNNIKKTQSVLMKVHCPKLKLSLKEKKYLEDLFHIRISKIETDLNDINAELLEEIKNKCESNLSIQENKLMHQFYNYISFILEFQKKRKKNPSKKKKESIKEKIDSIDTIETKELLSTMIKRKRPYSITKIRDLLNISNDDLLYELTDLLNESINDFSLEDDHKKRTIINIMNYINYNTDKLDLKNRSVILEKIYVIKKTCSKKLEDEKNKLDTLKKRENYEFLKDIHRILEYTVLNYQYEGKKRKQKLKDYNNGDPDLYHLATCVIFEQKDYFYVLELLKNFPSVLKLKDENSKSLFLVVLDYFIESLQNQLLEDILYYEKVLETFMDMDTVSVSLYELLEGTLKLQKLQEYFEKEKLSTFEFHAKEMIKSLQYKASKKKKTVEQIYLKYHMTKDYPEEILKCYQNKKPDFKKRCDLTEKEIFTIDSNKTKNYENAISLKELDDGKIEVGVYIIDTNFYTQENPFLEEEIKRRCYSENNVPMFPTTMIQNGLNLKENEKRPVQAYLFILNQNLEIEDFECLDAVIKVKKNLTFEDIHNILIKEEPSPFKKEIEEFSTLSYKLKVERLDISSSKEKQKLFVQSKVGEHLISEYTILLNRFLASLSYENDIPILYRNNKTEDIDTKILELKERYQTDSRFDEIIHLFSKIYHPSFYSSESFGHIGLHVKHYTEVTRPSRNFASHYNQEIIRKYKNNIIPPEEKIKDKIKVEELSKYLNVQRDWHISFQNELALVKKLRRK